MTSKTELQRVIVCGGRDYADKGKVWDTLSAAWIGDDLDSLAHGGASGADSLAGEWAQSMQIDYRVYPARWTLEGRSAGPRRNLRMLDDFKPALVIAFPGGRGTAHMVEIARKAGVDVYEVQ